MSLILLLAVTSAGLWVIRRDVAARPGVSGAVWIPTVWLAILASRPFSLWFDLGGSATLEGSPLDRAVEAAAVWRKVRRSMGVGEIGRSRNRFSVRGHPRKKSRANASRIAASAERGAQGPTGRAGVHPPARDRYWANNSATGTIFTAARRILSGKMLISWSAATTAAGLGEA